MQSGFDTRPYESMGLTHSPWGDSFDVVLGNCPLEALKKYPVIMFLGNITLKGELLERLKAYMGVGGILVANVAKIEEDAEAHQLFGVERTATRMGSTFSSCRRAGAKDSGSVCTVTGAWW